MKNTPCLHASISGHPTGQPTLVLMHFLGGSTREWDEVIALLGPDINTLALDLPGFGGSAQVPGYTVQQMADAVLASIRAHQLTRFLLVGHSMSGKVAMVLARQLRSNPGLSDPTIVGLLLVAPSPPAPEPIPDEKRTSMLALLGTQLATQLQPADSPDDLQRARSYITKNGERDIAEPVIERSAREVLRMDRAAWTAWLTLGSNEDWAARVGILDLPTLVVAGELDRSLGPDQQRRLTLPHLSRGRLAVVPGCSHLVPLERPELLAALLQTFLAEIVAAPTAVPQSYLDLIASDRVSHRTREVLESRILGPAPHPPVLSEPQLRTLGALLARILPQDPTPAVDLTAAIHARLAAGKGNGWRYAVLPEDLHAYREHLDSLTSLAFDHLPGPQQDAALETLTSLPGSPQARWFEELRSDAVEAYMAHPATLARIGYSGIGVGGAHTPHRGFASLAPNQPEPWEPIPESVPDPVPRA